MKWSEANWEKITPIFEKIKQHPFIEELMAGTLPGEKFAFYLQQDALYLKEFGLVLAGIASKSAYTAHTQAFLGFASDTVVVEQALHATFLKQFEEQRAKEQSPTCLLYTGFLHTQLHSGELPVAVATVLPCFWIYKAVGDFILQHQTNKKNPYQAWIDTYGGEEFGIAVQKALTIGDELAEESTEAQKQAMSGAFYKAAQMEWLFWDSAYSLEPWKI